MGFGEHVGGEKINLALSLQLKPVITRRVMGLLYILIIRLEMLQLEMNIILTH